jgi:hypothetical protein
MKILKYIAIDFVSTFSISILGMILQSHIGGALSNYMLIAIVCFFVGLFFTHGTAHGVSISVEVILLFLIILFMIGRPMSTPPSEILKGEIIGPLLPLIATGLVAGFWGEKIRKNKKDEPKESKKAKASDLEM